MPAEKRPKKKVRYRTGYKPTADQLIRIADLKDTSGKKKEFIRDRALDIGLAQIERNPALLEQAA